MLHLHCVGDWLDLCVHNLFNDSLDPVIKTVCSWCCVFSTCRVIFGICVVFFVTYVSRLSTIFNDSFRLDHPIGNSFLRDNLDHLNNFLLNLLDWHVNDLLPCAILYALLWHDLHTSDVTSIT